MKLTAESTVINDTKLNTNIDNAQTTADGARVIADEAKTIADDTAQFFWFTSSGDDTGAHISEKTRAEFETAPSGGNLLARSNGIAVRDGLQELANFSESGIVVGDFFDVTNGGGEISHAEYTSKSGRWMDAVTINLSTDETLSSAWQSVASGETFIIRVRYVYSGARTVTMTERVSFVKGTSSSETYATYDGANSITVTASYPPNTNPYQYKDSIALGVVTISATPLYRFGHDVADEGGGFCFLTGHGTKASANNYQFVCGKFNEEVSGYLVVGKGTSDTNRSNAFVVGTGGELYCKGHSTSIGSTTRTSLSSALSVPSNTDKNVLSLTIPAGSWVIEGQVRFASGAIGLRRIALSPNSADTSDATIDTYAGAQTNAVSGQQTIMNISLVVAISEDTRFYLCARQSASSAVNAEGALIKAIRIA